MLHIFSCQSSSLNALYLTTALKELAFSDLAKRRFLIAVWITVILDMICMLHYFFICWFILPNDLPIDHPHPHLRSSFLLSKMLQYFIKCSLHRDRNIWWPKWLQYTCISSVNCTQNWELPVALSVTSETFGDVKMKHDERVYNGVISSWTRVSDGVKKQTNTHTHTHKNHIIKTMSCSLAICFTGDQFFENSPSQAKFLCAGTSLNEYDPQ